MYLGVDIGGSKTILATFLSDGEIKAQQRFVTSKNYDEFLRAFAATYESLGSPEVKAACVGVPGRLEREEGIAIAFGNLPWKNVHVARDLEKLLKAPVIIENDAKLAGLSEAKLIIHEFKKVLYVTISTGIGTGIITNGVIDPEFLDSEGGHMMLEYRGKLQEWEDFASGRAIEKRYGKQARDITDKKTWKEIAHAIALGMVNLIAVVQPDVIVIGGGVGTHFNEFDDLLRAELKKFETPLTPIPPLKRAKRPEEAVLYGCYELIKQTYGHTA
jgi:glucokinase